MGVESSRHAEGDPKESTREKRSKDNSQSESMKDALRKKTAEIKKRKDDKAAQEEAKDAQRAFDSDYDRVKRVNQWANNASFYQYPVREDPDPYATVNHDTVNRPTSADSADEHRYPLPNLDGLSSEELQAYKVKRDEIVDDAQKGLGELSKKYYSDMEKLESKIYPNPKERRATLMRRYNTFKDEVQLILNAQTIKMGRLADKYGFKREQLLPYTSTTENGGIHQLPDAPRSDD